jgi:hypothetical protein
MLGPLRVNADAYIPPDNPYSYEGSAGSWDDQELQRAFAKANEIVVEQDSPRHSPFFSLSVGGTPLSAGNPDATSPPAVWTIKVTKVGLLNRKDDLLEGGRKAPNRKWKPWSVILTGSQLLLFRDPALATNLLAQSNSPNVQALVTQSSAFRPDESLSVGESVAVFDTSYAKVRPFLYFAALSLTAGYSMITPCVLSCRMVDSSSFRRQTAEN